MEFSVLAVAYIFGKFWEIYANAFICSCMVLEYMWYICPGLISGERAKLGDDFTD